MTASRKSGDSQTPDESETAKKQENGRQRVASAKSDRQHAPMTSDSVSRNWHNLDNRLSMIAEAAYFKAERRGFASGHEVVDWLEAEREFSEIMGET